MSFPIPAAILIERESQPAVSRRASGRVLCGAISQPMRHDVRRHRGYLAKSQDGVRGSCRLSDTVRLIDVDEVYRLHPALNQALIVAGLDSPEDMDIRVVVLHWGYIRGIRARRGLLAGYAEALSLKRSGPRQRGPAISRR